MVRLTNTNSDKDANVTGLFARINNKENTRTYVGQLKISQEFESREAQQGFAGMLAVGKTSSNYQYDLYSIVEDDNYNPNDLGFLYSNNEITNGLRVQFIQFNEGKRFIDFSSGIRVLNVVVTVVTNFFRPSYKAMCGS